MFHYFVRDMALSGEPDRMTPGVIVSRLIGASLAVSLVGGTSIFAIMLVGKAMAWAAVAVTGFWFAGWMFGLPALRRGFRDEPLLRVAIDVVYRMLAWTIPLQAVVLMTVAIIAASTMLGTGGANASAADNIYEGLMTSVFVVAFLLAFGGIMFAGYLMIIGDLGGGGLAWKLLGWLLVLAGIAVFFPGFLYLEDGLLALQRAWGSGWAGLAVIGGQVLGSFAIAGAFGAWIGPRTPTACLSTAHSLLLVARKGRLRGIRLDDGTEAWSTRVKQPVCAMDAGGRLALHDLPGDFVAARAVANGQLQNTFGPLKNALLAGAVSPDGQLVALLDEDGYLSLWTMAEGRRLWEQDTAFGDDGLGLAFAPPTQAQPGAHAHLFASRRNGKVVTFDANTGQVVKEPDSAAWIDGDAFTQPRPHPNGRAWTIDATDKTWAFAGSPDAPTPGPQGQITKEDGSTAPVLTTQAVDARGARLAVSDGQRCAVFEGKDSLVAQRDFGRAGVKALALSDDGAELAIVAKRAVFRWDLRRDEVRELTLRG